MSCKSVLSNSVRSSGGSYRQNHFHEKLHTSTSTEEKIKFAGDESKDRLYEPKQNKKMMRVLTVIIYVFSVSLAAIMLSLYYGFFWKAPPFSPTNMPPKKSLVSDNVTNKTACSCVEKHDGPSHSVEETPTFIQKETTNTFITNSILEEDSSTINTTDYSEFLSTLNPPTSTEESSYSDTENSKTDSIFLRKLMRTTLKISNAT